MELFSAITLPCFPTFFAQSVQLIDLKEFKKVPC